MVGGIRERRELIRVIRVIRVPVQSAASLLDCLSGCPDARSVGACYDRSVVADLVQFVGYGVLKLVTLGRYRGDDGIFLEGCVGLFLLATMFFLLHKLVM
jgi:hypothetical protein